MLEHAQNDLAVRGAARRLGLAAIRYGYAPALVGLSYWAAARLIWGGSEPGRLATGILALCAALLGASLVAERLLPWNPAWNRPRRDVRRDVLHLIVNEGTSIGPILLGVAMMAAAPRAPFWPESWPIPAQILLVLVAFDLGQTAFHWAAHHFEPLWRLHAIHHSVERLYGWNGPLKHPLYQLLSGGAALLPLTLLGMPPRLGLFLAIAAFTQLLLQHSNVDYRTGVGRRIFATAEVHRFHHDRSLDRPVNFALFFSLWDALLGTAYWSPRRLETDQVGVDLADYPVDYGPQLLAPFQRFTSTRARPVANRLPSRQEIKP